MIRLLRLVWSDSVFRYDFLYRHYVNQHHTIHTLHRPTELNNLSNHSANIQPNCLRSHEGVKSRLPGSVQRTLCTSIGRLHLIPVQSSYRRCLCCAGAIAHACTASFCSPPPPQRMKLALTKFSG